MNKLKAQGEVSYTLPDIARKLEKGLGLNPVEQKMAAGVIRGWLEQKQAKIKGGKIGGKISKGGGRPALKKRNRKIYELSETLSQKEIAAQFGISESRVSKIIKEFRNSL